MNGEKEAQESENPEREAPEDERIPDTERELVIRVCKVELPVRPRGVLAE